LFNRWINLLKTLKNCLKIGLTYVVPKLKHSEEVREEPRNFQIEIIDRLDKYKDRDLDKAIRK